MSYALPWLELLFQKAQKQRMLFDADESDCGANGPGGHGFQPGNTCGKEKASKASNDEKPPAALPAKPEHSKDADKTDLSPQDDYAQNGVRSKAFKSWFGDWEKSPETASKVVDDDGNPQINHGEIKRVHHGTSGEFSEFDPAKMGSNGSVVGRGFYFAENYEMANMYAQGSGNVIDAYLNVRNPFIWEQEISEQDGYAMLEKAATHLEEIRNSKEPNLSKGNEAWAERERERKRNGMTKTMNQNWAGVIRQRARSGDTLHLADIHYVLTDVATKHLSNEIVARLGFDGIRHETRDLAGTPQSPHQFGIDESRGRVWIVFDPPQIKAVKNEGTFDSGTADIYKRFDLHSVADAMGTTAAIPRSVLWHLYDMRQRGLITSADFETLRRKYEGRPEDPRSEFVKAFFAKAATVQTSLNKPKNTEHVGKAQSEKPAWMFVKPDRETRQKLLQWQKKICQAIDGAKPVKDLHITLFHHLLAPGENMKALKKLADDNAACGAVFDGVLAFREEDCNAVVIEVKSPELERLRDKMSRQLQHEPSRHAFRPHVTICRIPFDEGLTVEGLRPLGITGHEFLIDAVILDNRRFRRRIALRGAGIGYLNAFEPTPELTSEFDKKLQQRSLFGDDEQPEPAPVADPVPGDNCGTSVKGSPGFKKGNKCAAGDGEKLKPIPALPPDEYKGPKRNQRWIFEKPIIGPTGAHLTGYEWRFTGSFDEEGEEIKVSDWDNAEQSVETGRRIVHVFDIVDVNGEAKTVSLESALMLMGYLDPRSAAGKETFLSLTNALKRQALLALQITQETNPAKKAVLEEKAAQSRENVAKWQRLASDPDNNPDARRDLIRQAHKRLELFRTDVFGRHHLKMWALPDILAASPYNAGSGSMTRDRAEADKIVTALAKAVKANSMGGIEPTTILADDQHGMTASDDAQIKRSYSRNSEQMREMIAKADEWLEKHHVILKAEKAVRDAIAANKRPADVWQDVREKVRRMGSPESYRMTNRVRQKLGWVWDEAAESWVKYREPLTRYPEGSRSDIDIQFTTKSLGMSTLSGESGGMLQLPKRRKAKRSDDWMDVASKIIKSLDAQYDTEEWPADDTFDRLMVRNLGA